jgi:hypothetical protein
MTMGASEFGFLEGDTCGRKGCVGVLAEHEVENCSCHIAPPCSACTAPREYCPECGWQAKDDTVMAEGAITLGWGFARVERKPRVLDRSKIDYVKGMHSSSSMKVTGVFPPGTTKAEVLELVEGTFGGRFERFNPETGDFTYIAYTD